MADEASRPAGRDVVTRAAQALQRAQLDAVVERGMVLLPNVMRAAFVVVVVMLLVGVGFVLYTGRIAVRLARELQHVRRVPRALTAAAFDDPDAAAASSLRSPARPPPHHRGP